MLLWWLVMLWFSFCPKSPFFPPLHIVFPNQHIMLGSRFYTAFPFPNLMVPLNLRIRQLMSHTLRALPDIVHRRAKKLNASVLLWQYPPTHAAPPSKWALHIPSGVDQKRGPYPPFCVFSQKSHLICQLWLTNSSRIPPLCNSSTTAVQAGVIHLKEERYTHTCICNLFYSWRIILV